jgi:hypothetical protein
MRQLRAIAALLVLMLGSAGPVAAADPELNVTAPKNGVVIQSNSVTVNFTTANIKLVPTTVSVSEAGKHPEENKPGEGHVHFVLDLQPLVVWEKGDPYTFTNVPAGAHQLMVELVENDHSSLSPRVMQMIQFEVAPGMLPTTGAESRSGWDAGFNVLLLGLLLLSGGWLALSRAHSRTIR